MCAKTAGKKCNYRNKYNLFFKNFDSVRDIVRSAFLYGGYSKADYCKLTGISPRKYEDTVRFMQAVFGEDYYTYGNKGKEKYARLNYKSFENCGNPLAKVAFFKGFSGNDFNCYFLAHDLLSEKPEGLTIDEIADVIAEYNNNLMAIGTIRNGMNALVDEGYLVRIRHGHKDYYSLAEDISLKLTHDELTEIADFLAFYKEIYKQGISLYTLVSKLPESDFGKKARLTDYYPVQVLDAEIKHDLETAITGKVMVKFAYIDPKRIKTLIDYAAPVRLITGEYGRQYVICYADDKYGVFRLDRIHDLELTGTVMEVEFNESCLDKVWCASISQEQTEHYIEIDFGFGSDRMLADRLITSRKFGEVTEVEGVFRFTITVKDYGEMLPMLRSFYGYIVRVSNCEVKDKVLEDIRRIGGTYGVVQ